MSSAMLPFSTNRNNTPKTIQALVLITTIASILSALLNQLFIHGFGIMGTQEILSLSLSGIMRFFLWQPITYMFIHPISGGISLFFLIFMTFNILLLWIIGSAVIKEIGRKPFLNLYFLSGLTAGLSALFIMAITGQSILMAGCTANIYALLVVWAMLHPETELLFLMIIPIKAKWLAATIIGVDLLITLSNGNFISFAAHLTAPAVAYFYALIAWELKSPFALTQNFDGFFNNLGHKYREKVKKREEIEQHSYKQAKIFDFKTGEALLSDDEFVDAMLSKISTHGKASLSKKEKKRLDQVSKNKRKK